MQETQESISTWAEETFGPVGSNARVAARANEEMAELLRALSADDNNPKAAEEAADVKIVLYRLAERMGLNLDAAEGHITYTYQAVSNFHAAVNANQEMAALLKSFGNSPRPSRPALTLLVHMLRDLCGRMGFDLDEEIDRKMVVNRARVWNLDGSGHGYHVRDKAAVK